MARLRRAGGKWLRYPALVLGGALALFVALSLVAKLVAPLSTLMLRDLVTFQGFDRQWIALDDAADVLKRSIIASEDQTFCSHNGVEWEALQVQLDLWRAGEDARGASTISMQVARNLFLWQGQSPIRKALEVPIAVWLDFVFGKRRMLEIYINIAELGPRRYGFEAAAQAAFGVSAGQLNRNQAALLVAALPLPAARDAANPTSRQVRLARTIAARAPAMAALATCLAPPPPPAPPVPQARPGNLGG
ncbi:MAG: transglycosylase domain-containing protein [Devosiaceae bacterium]|nr:transglycosylase domain-containing protein [Devosiaceae bacterium MH13]